MATKFREVRDGHNVYDYVCEGCGAEGELGVPVDEHATFGCPEGCGATYIQWVDSRSLQDGAGQGPTLTCVVCPVFEDKPATDNQEPKTS